LAGRLLAGVASGAAFSSGAARIKELSATRHRPRRLTIAISAGYGLGALLAGVLARWAPAPTVLPYVPHRRRRVSAGAGRPGDPRR
jgi:MFS family permease